MTARSIHLGFEVGTGARVDIPIAHMCVTGQTQQAGKTTALEALVTRSGLRAVTFITKRGEGSFTGGRRMAPFFRERADWQFVGSLIDATIGEKNKLLRAWLMKVCRNTKTLAEVQANVETAKATARGFSESIYTEIAGYLELVVPQLAELPPARKVSIGPGLNVMDLSPYRAELQGLVIRSVIEHVYEHENDVVTVIPEAWEFLPEGRGSPVKLAAETLIRKGAALRNFIWADAQDLGGLWKTIVRAAAVYLVGVQREANEVKRTLGNLPASAPKLNAADVASLELGQFYACWGRYAIKTYVQPTWLDARAAREIATGVRDIHVAAIKSGFRKLAAALAPQEDIVTKDEAERLERENQDLRDQVKRLEREIADMSRRFEALEKGAHERDARADQREPVSRSVAAADRGAVAGASRGDSAPASRTARAFTAEESFDNEKLYQAFKARLIDEAPALLKMLTTRTEIEMTVTRKVLTLDEYSTKGRLARLLKEGFFSEPKTPSMCRTAMKRTGPDANTANIGRALDDLTRDGFVTDEGSGYREVSGMKVNIVDAAA